MFHELDTVVLLHDHLQYGLLAGDVGTVVHVYRGGAALEVEFVTTDGRTVGVLTLGVEETRPLGAHGIFHVRELIPA